MTSESDLTARRFPVVLTICTVVALAILCGLGTWQLERLKWKTDLLDRIAALRDAPAAPIGPVLARARAGEDVAWTRVTVACAPRPPGGDHVRNAVRDGEIVWRVTSPCGLEGAAYGAILVDHGVVEAAVGAVERPTVNPVPVGTVTGVLAPLAALSKEAEAARPEDAPDLAIMAETETPPPAGIAPAPLPPDIPNRHLEYALTWYGLAVVLLAVYAALLRRRLKSR